MELRGRNVNYLYLSALVAMRQQGDLVNTRNGRAFRIQEPVTLVARNPMERVLFNSRRNANPFFHLAEALWMLAGRRDVNFIAHYNSNMRSYSDDGKVFRGAYGFRWRVQFGYDQISYIIHTLEDHTTRRAVLGMYDPIVDSSGSLDIPCNTHAYFDIVDSKLNMTVCNRSNDLVWGCLGANAVHFSMLQEVIAMCVGVKVGTYYQFTNNLHVYEHHFPLLNVDATYQIKDYPPIIPIGIGLERPCWAEVSRHIEEFVMNPTEYEGGMPFLSKVARPMLRAWDAYKRREPDPRTELIEMPECDWKHASSAWLSRKNYKWGAPDDDARWAKVDIAAE